MDLVIAGGGPSNAHLLNELALPEQHRTIESITIIDPKQPSAGGTVHSDPSPAFRVNMTTGRHDIPGQIGFEQCLSERGAPQWDPPRRYDLGLYTGLAAERAIAGLRERGCDVRRVVSRAVAVEPFADGRYVVRDEQGGLWPADRVVLATGHEPPSPPEKFASDNDTRVSLYCGDSRFAERIDRDDRVTTLGSGPSAIDVARYLIEDLGTHRQVHLRSRHGLLSAVQTLVPPRAGLIEETRAIVEELERSCEAPSLERLGGSFGPLLGREEPGFDFELLVREAQAADPLAQLRRDIADARQGGPAWRQVLEVIGLFAPRLWRWLGPEEQARLMRERDGLWLRLYYTKRHAMQMGTARWLEAMIADGRVTVGAAGSDRPLPEYDRLVVATGPEYRVSRSGNPMLRQMLATGLARPHAAPSDGYEIGGLQTRGFQLTDAPGIYAMGSLVRGEDFAVHGFPALARHARAIVAQWL